jgi:hypothetical protein
MDNDMVERQTIRDLIENWVLWRDAGDWERFRGVWHADGRMMATWFQGSAEEFIEVSRAGFDKLKSRGREGAPFEIRYQNGKGPEVVHADAVIDVALPHRAVANAISGEVLLVLDEMMPCRATTPFCGLERNSWVRPVTPSG